MGVLSDTEIGNLALAKLGVARVQAFTDDSKAARALTVQYAARRDEELRAHLWNFAMKRAELSADVAAPAFGFAKAYTLPGDCLRLVEVGPYNMVTQLADYRTGGDAPFSVEGGKILCDLSAPLRVRYVAQVTSVSAYDPSFVEALACRLAAELAEELTGSESKQTLMWQRYKLAVKEARRLDAIENPADVNPDDSWVLGRL